MIPTKKLTQKATTILCTYAKGRTSEKKLKISIVKFLPRSCILQMLSMLYKVKLYYILLARDVSCDIDYDKRPKVDRILTSTHHPFT